MSIKKIEAKSILRKHKKIDSWFLSRYGMNLYRGCTHNCVYCDGRAEGYYVEGEFGNDVTVKVNAIEILQRELDPRRKRTLFKPGYMMVGGGVGDSYQSVEKEYQLTRQALQLVHQHKFPVHMLTKSTLIQRDADILQQINNQTRAIVSFSFSSVDENISAIFEPGVPSPTDRLQTLAFFKKLGIPIGMFLLPVIPFITDLPDLMENAVKKAADIGVDFIIFGGMTLKPGRQCDFFQTVLKKHYPHLISQYDKIYTGDKWGQAMGEYYQSINQTFWKIAKQYNMPLRIPINYFDDILDENDLVVVILEHIDYILKMKNRTSPFGYAAYSISQLKEPISAKQDELRTLKGIGQTTERIILEILKTGHSSYYKKLLHE